MNFLETEDVVKQYANHLALDKVSIQVPEGKVFGLLGPNGAGKTTLIRIINRITAPDSGLVRFNGREFQPEDIYQIGYLPEERGLYKKLEELSKGMQQKIQFIITIIHEPKLLIFDEPFSGFDPVNAELLKKEILELKDAGHTIIFSTHNMSSVEEICDNIALINRSQVVLSGNVTEVKSRFRTNNFTLRFHTGSGKLQPIPEMFSLLTEKDLAGTSEVRIHKEPGITNSALLSALAGQTEIISFTEEIPSMNDIFINTVSGTNTTQA